jgi:hypothetical protein
MSDDEKMDALLRQMATEEYNRPPQIVPREQMWEAVQQGLGTGDKGLGNSGIVPLAARVPRWVYFAAAAVLLLAVGIQVGRWMSTSPAQNIARQTPQRDSTVAPIRDTTKAPPSVVLPVEKPNETVVHNDDGGKGPPRPKGGPERQLSPDLANDVSTKAYTVAATQHLTEAEAMLLAFKGDLSQGRMDAEMSAWGKELLSNTRLLLNSPAAKDPGRRKLLQDLELVLVQIVQLSPKSSARDRELIKGALTDDQVLTRLRTAIPVKGT